MRIMNMMVKSKVDSAGLVTDGIGTDILKGSACGAGFMGVGVLGAWVVSCFVGGIMSAGGILHFVGSWFKAISGI
jgi:hypothetical protein